MRSLILALLLVVCFVPYLAEQGWIPAVAKYREEGIALVVTMYVVVVGARSQFRNVRPEYWFILVALVSVMVCGIVINAVGPGPVDTPLWDTYDPDSRPGFTPRAAMLRPEAVADAVAWVVSRPAAVNVDELRLSAS